MTENILVSDEFLQYAIVAATVSVAFVLGKILRFALLAFYKRCEVSERLVLAVTAQAGANIVTPVLLVAGVGIGAGMLVFPPKIQEVVNTSTELLYIVVIGYAIFQLISVAKAYLLRKAAITKSKLDDMFVPVIINTLRCVIVFLALVQIAQALSDKPLTSIIASLGIGGLAIALAAQESIKNFFGSIMIFSDRPFDLGDRIQVDGFDGPVKSVGLRSTRIETLDGHLVTIPNAALANKSIKNISYRKFIRKNYNIGLRYDTPIEKIELALNIIKEELKDHEGMKDPLVPRVYLNDLKPDCINIIVLIWYHPPAYWDFLAFCENFNKAIISKFQQEGIEFALPSQRIFLEKHN